MFTKNEFRVGDRVVCVAECGKEDVVGKVGTVRRVHSRCVEVEFDEYINGHSLSGTCRNGYGWVFGRSDECLEHLMDETNVPFEIDEDAWNEYVSKYIHR